MNGHLYFEIQADDPEGNTFGIFQVDEAAK
jgi:hypothetical protein